MSQLDPNPMHQYGDNPRSPTTPTIEQLLREDAQIWSPRSHSSSPISARSQEVDDPEYVYHHPKKLTVLAKVKEKARRWRQNFLRKKHSDGDNTTPSWGVRLEDEDGRGEENEDPEYLGAPMYESELAPEGYKEHARQHPRAIPVISEKHVLSSSSVQPVSGPTASETEKHATHETSKHGAHEADRFATQETEKHGLNTDTPITPRENKWDKGVSVKEYIKNKFEPGEDEKALSEVISDAMSPRKRTPGDLGVIEKVKGAVNSLLWKEEPAQSTMDHSATNSSPHIPISSNAQAVMKEDNEGRILQAN